MAAGTISYGLVIEALLNLKLPVTIQAAILISRHVCPPLLEKGCLLFFRALLFRDLRLQNLFLFFVLSCAKFAIQIHASYLEGRSMGLQYMFIPAVGVHKGTTGTMENSPIINQWISAHSAIHLFTSYDITTEELRFFKEPRFVHRHFRYPLKKSKANFLLDID